MLSKCVNHDKGKYVFLAIAIIIIAIIMVDVLKLQIFKVLPTKSAFMLGLSSGGGEGGGRVLGPFLFQMFPFC